MANGERQSPFEEPLRSLYGQVIKQRLAEDESVDNVLAVTELIARKRANLFERQPVSTDFQYALSLFCCWPFKDEIEPNQKVIAIRRSVVKAVQEGNADALDVAVPLVTLALSVDALGILQRVGSVSDLLRTPVM